MKRLVKFSAIILMMSLLAAGCAGTSGEVDQNVGKIEAGEKTDPAAEETLSPEEQAAIEAEKAAKEEAEKNAAQSTENAVKETQKQETEAPQTTESTTEAPENDAIVDGTLLKQYDSAYMMVGANSAEGWIILYDAEGKGFGTPYFAYNTETGMTIDGEEGAEVYFCPDGILQLEWRYQGSGNPASAATVLLYYPQSDGAPKTFDLYLKKYDYSGNFISEEFILSYTQTEEYTYGDVYNAVSAVLAKYGADTSSYADVYGFVDENGDAVAYDSDGNEIARYPGKGADAMMMALSMIDGESYACVSYMSWPSYTDIYQMN